MGKGRGRPGGNPDFGNKLRFTSSGDKPLSDVVATRVPTETKLELKKAAQEQNCTVPELIRAAIERYLDEIQDGHSKKTA